MDNNLRMLPNSIPRECSTYATVGLLTYRSHIQPSQYKIQWHKELDVQLRITAAGLCKNFTCFPKHDAFTNCGAKLVQKNDIRKFLRCFL